MKIIKRIGIFCLYFLIVLTTFLGATANEIPFVQLQDTSGISYLNIFNYNTSVHNNLTGKQGGLAPDEYYHLNYAQYLLIGTLLGNETYFPFLNVDWINGSNATFLNITKGGIEVATLDDLITDTNCSIAGTCTEIVYYNNASWVTDNQNYNTTDEIFNVVDNGTFLKSYDETDPIWLSDKSDYWNKSTDLNVGVNITTSGWFNGKFNWTIADNWNSFDGISLDFNESKLEVTYFLASSIQVITGTGSGTLSDIQTYNRTTYNVTESNSDYELRVNFTGIIDFTTLLVRHKSSADAGHLATIQIWDYEDSVWEGYGYLTEGTSSTIKTIGVYDSSEHIQDGVVQVRFYQDEPPPNLAHIHQFDWVGLSKGFGTPTGQETDPLSWHLTDFSIGDYSTTAEILGFSYYNLTDFSIGDYSTTAESGLLYAPINYNPFDQSLNITDNVQFNNVTIDESIDWGNDIEEYANATCKVIRAGTTYFEVCK